MSIVGPKQSSTGETALRENKLKTLWKNGGVAVNGWLGIPSSASAESMARCGWDSVVVDMQHGLVDYTDAVPMLQAISQTDATPMVRVPWNMPDIIMKSLDAGAYGVVCPMINTPAEWEKQMIALGYQLVTLGNDNSLMMGAARAAIAATREGVTKPGEKSMY